jgi:hypothetical protein
MPAPTTVDPDLDLDPLGLAVPIADDDLCAQALAADPDAPLGADAIPFASLGDEFPTLLPAWYMPVATARVRTRWHAVVVALIIFGFVVINACGYCITYGRLTFG